MIAGNECHSDTTPCELSLTSRGKTLGLSPDEFGRLVPTDRDASAEGLRAQLAKLGYLYVPNFFVRDDVLAVRKSIVAMLAEDGLLDERYDAMEAIPHPSRFGGLAANQGSANNERIGLSNTALHELIYSQHTLKFFERIVGGPVLHFDYTWFRAVPPGMGTVPHCDVVYMGRGTSQLFTCWVPYGDISYAMGGLMVLENSASRDCQQRLAKYLRRDVDEYCSNRPLPEHIDLESPADNKVWNGWLARNPVTLRANLGGRWLTTEYRMGDALIFSTNLVHASLDNQSNQIRLSSDSRYQAKSEPFDERFVGEGPYGHTGPAKRGRVC